MDNSLPRKPLMIADVRRSSPVQKSGFSEEQKKRTIHLLQNRTFYLLLTFLLIALDSPFLSRYTDAYKKEVVVKPDWTERCFRVGVKTVKRSPP